MWYVMLQSCLLQTRSAHSQIPVTHSSDRERIHPCEVTKGSFFSNAELVPDVGEGLFEFVIRLHTITCIVMKKQTSSSEEWRGWAGAARSNCWMWSTNTGKSYGISTRALPQLEPIFNGCLVVNVPAYATYFGVCLEARIYAHSNAPEHGQPVFLVPCTLVARPPTQQRTQSVGVPLAPWS